MGGDHGPSVVVRGVATASSDLDGVRFLLHGDEALLAAALARTPAAAGVCEIRPSSSVIAMDAKPAHAMRRGKGSSLWNPGQNRQAGGTMAPLSAGQPGGLRAIPPL